MITSLRLENFKNFADETLRLGPFTVIVGANASGKSNIRDAFRFLHGIGYGCLLPEIISGPDGVDYRTVWEPIRGAANEIARLGESEFALEAEIDISSQETDVKKFRNLLNDWSSPTPTGMSYAIRAGCDATPERGFSLLSVSFRADTGYVWERPKNWQWDNLRMNLCLPSVGEEGDQEGLLLNSLIRDTFRSIRFFDPAPDYMRQPSFPKQIVLGNGGENLPTVMQEICADENRKATLIEWTRELTPMDVRDFGFPIDPSGRVHLMIREEGGREVSAYSASDGTLRFLAMLAALLGPKPAGLYFIEEIENGIHPSRLHLLLDLIETQTEKGKFQVVATTHSPALLTAMSDRTFEDASVVCRLPGTTDAIIRPVRALPDAAELRKTQGLGRLLEGGWMETALAFTEGNRNGEGDAE